MKLIIGLLLLCVAPFTVFSDACVDLNHCTCRRVDTYLNVVCGQTASHIYTTIPYPLPLETSSLFLFLQEIKSIKREDFPSLLYLEEITIKRCQVKTLIPMCFQRVNSILRLELPHNSIQRLQEKTFWGLRKLKHLNLQNNVVDYIHLEAFVGLRDLLSLNLDTNHLKRLPLALGLLSSLEFASFDGNAIQLFPVDLWQIRNISSISILQTAVLCDCKLWGYRRWLEESSSQKAWDIDCSKFEKLKDARIEGFRCEAPAEVTVMPGNQTVRAGDDVSFTCQTDCMAGLNFTWVQPNPATSSVETWTLENLFREDTQGFLSNYNRSCVSVLRLTRVSVLDAGSYTCEVTAPHMPSGTHTAFLTVTSHSGQTDNIITTSARPSSDGLGEDDYVYLLPSHNENDGDVQPVSLHINVTIVCSNVVTVVAAAYVLFLCLRRRNRLRGLQENLPQLSGVQAAILQPGGQASALVLNNSHQVFKHGETKHYENNDGLSDTNVADGYETIPDYYNAQAEVDFVRNRTGSRAAEDNVENHQYETIPDYV